MVITQSHQSPTLLKNINPSKMKKRIFSGLTSTSQNIGELLQEVQLAEKNVVTINYNNFLHKLLNYFLKQHIQVVSMDSSINLHKQTIEEVTQWRFIPATTEGYICFDNKRKLLPLSRKFGRLCLLNYHETQNIEY